MGKKINDVACKHSRSEYCVAIVSECELEKSITLINRSEVSEFNHLTHKEGIVFLLSVTSCTIIEASIEKEVL